MGHREHRRNAPLSVPTAILTVSDTRTEETDTAGGLIRRLLREGGHPVADYRILPDEPRRIRRMLREWGADPKVRAVILTGGTGVSPRDRTAEAVTALLDRELPGFGEIFRWLSYREVGPAAMLSRAVAGVFRDKAIFALPGSEAAVRLAMTELILPELGHLVGQIAKGKGGAGEGKRRRGSFKSARSTAGARGGSAPEGSAARGAGRTPRRR
jgi:molybdenum cofactor biosynthesis protein B